MATNKKGHEIDPVTKREVKKAGSLKNVYYRRAAEDTAIGMTLEESRNKQIAQRVGKSEMTRRRKESKGGTLLTKLVSEQ